MEYLQGLIKREALSDEQNKAAVLEAKRLLIAMEKKKLAYEQENGQNKLKLKAEYESLKDEYEKAAVYILEHNMGLIGSIFQSFYKSCNFHGKIHEDFAVEILVKFNNYIKNFSPEKEVNFSTYFGECLKRSGVAFFKSINCQKQVPYNAVSSLDKIVGNEDSAMTNYNKVSSQLYVEHSFEEDLFEDNKDLIKKMFFFLSPQEKQIVLLRMKGLILSDIATKLSLSTERVRQILDKKVALLKTLYEMSKYNSFKLYSEVHKPEDVKEARKMYHAARHVFLSQKVNFNKCFEYIDCDIRYRFMLKKVENIFNRPKESKAILCALAQTEGMDYKLFFKNQRQAYSHEVRLNKKLTKLGKFINEIVKINGVYISKIKLDIYEFSALKAFSPEFVEHVYGAHFSKNEQSKISFNTENLLLNKEKIEEELEII